MFAPSKCPENPERSRTGPIGGFVDLGLHSGPHDGANRMEFALMGGAVFQKPLARCPCDGISKEVCPNRVLNMFQPFLRVAPLAGVRTKDGTSGAASWALGTGVGVGLDVCFHNDYLCGRVEYDHIKFLWRKSIAGSYRRFSAGLVFRFERPEEKGSTSH